jgi:hypothetical protein
MMVSQLADPCTCKNTIRLFTSLHGWFLSHLHKTPQRIQKITLCYTLYNNVIKGTAFFIISYLTYTVSQHDTHLPVVQKSSSA